MSTNLKHGVSIVLGFAATMGLLVGVACMSKAEESAMTKLFKVVVVRGSITTPPEDCRAGAS
jgi:hypothetical protein